MEVLSDRYTIKMEAATLYSRLSNFSNFGSMLPDKVKNFVATENECSFEIDGLASVKLYIKEKTEPSFVHMQTVAGASPMPLDLKFLIEDKGDSTSSLQLQIEAQVPQMMSFMLKPALSKFANQVCQAFSNK